MNFISVESSNIDAIAVSGDNLVIRFKNGSIYEYIGAAKEYEKMMAFKSKGEYLNNFIKNKYPFNRIK